MKAAKRIQSSFFPAAWWNEREIEKWRDRPALDRAIRAKRRCKVTPDQRPMGALAGGRKPAGRIIAVSDEPFNRGEEFARAVAARLGWQYLDSARLIEHAVARGGNRRSLEKAIKGSRWRAGQQLTQVLLLQAALAENIKNGNAICYGIAADLLSLETSQVRRIVIVAPYCHRRQAVEEHKGLFGAEARIFLNDCDRARRRWRKRLIHIKAGSPSRYDLAINLEELSLDIALAAALEMIRERSGLDTFDLAPVQNFVLHTSIRAGLAIHPATANLDLDVEILNKTAVLRGTVRDSEEFEVVRRVLLSIAPEATFDLTQMRLAKANRKHHWSIPVPSEVESWNGASHRIDVAPRLAWTFAGLSALVLAVVAGFWYPEHRSHPAASRLLNVAGVITDSDCGLSRNLAQQTAECVRACVKTRGARYVFSNGFRMFTLADQQKGAALAGERVVATGYLDAATGYLQLRSVQSVAR